MRAPYAALQRHPLFVVVALTLAFRFWLAAVFPITGDEAYFIYWGANPDWGFYDHPPMVGWLLALLLQASSAEWVLRLPAILAPAIIAGALYLGLRDRGEDKAVLACLGFLLVPINVWNVFITTDTPLVLLCFFSLLAFRRAIECGQAFFFALSGVLLGLAFLSKYFAALLGLVYLGYLLASPRDERAWGGFWLTFACALPFAAANAWWNWEHCWANLMFNLYNRHGEAGLSWKTPLLYALMLLYVLSPVALVQLARGRAGLAARWREPSFRLFAVASALPLALFALLSALKTIGLHWVLSFVPFFYALAALVLSVRQLRASVVFLGIFSLVHASAVLVAGALPLEVWSKSRLYDGIVFHFRIGDIARELARYRGEFELAADGYSPAVTTSFYLGRAAATAGSAGGADESPTNLLRNSYVFVFGNASSHARHDDILTDFRRLAGKNILVFRKNPPEASDYAPYFRSVEYRSLSLSGATFHLVFGRGFDYAAYRDRVLAPLRDKYYAIPRYLPQGRCYFCERYFGASTCPPPGGKAI
ncbi:MAG: glycosyltransferase family 39 protein [Betaproteobacteria bacterium]|nr:glycosyltransferase family 39 protein [Betaproteobacteria bacterium]